jgi:hypothetical protein
MNEARRPVYDNYEDILHRHYREHYESGRYPFDRYEVAYMYGFNLMGDEAYRNREWNEIEGEVRRAWEQQEAGPWEDFKEAIQHAWETAQDAVSGE